MIPGGLPTPLFSTPAEDYPAPPNELRCDADPKAREGVIQWANFIKDRLGGVSGGIVRNCPMGIPIIDPKTEKARPSGHYTGRAWDWMMDATKETDRATVQKLMDWLNANDNEIFRRLGLSYMIWNKQSFSAYYKKWQPTQSYDPHTTHVHFSFGDAGADGKTSFFQWLADGMPSVEGNPPAPQLPWQKNEAGPSATTRVAWFLIGLGTGIVAPIVLDYGYRRLAR